jgi:hypothetical protein
MPTVPRIGQPIDTAPLPNARVSTGAPAAAFGGAAKSIDVGGLGRHIAGIIEDEQQKADQVAVLDADNKLASLESSLLYDQKTGVLNRRGQAAFTAPEDVDNEWKKQIGEIEKGLTTDRQLLAFRGRAQSRYQSIFSEVQRHVAGERQQYDTDTTTAALANRYDTAVRSSDPKVVDRSVAESRAILATFAKRNGWSPEVAQEKTATVVSRIHAGVVDKLLANEQDVAASEYYAAHKSEITGDQVARLEGALELGSVRGESQRQADQIIGAAKGMPDALDAVRKIADPKIRDATDQRVKQYFAEQKVAQDERRVANYQTATNIVEQSRDVNKVPPSLWASFTVGERSELRNYAEKLVKGEPIVTDWTRYYDLMALASSDATKQQFLKVNLLADRGHLGDAEFKQLTDLQSSLRKDDGKAQAQLGGYRTVHDIVEQAIGDMGLRITGLRASQQDKDKASLFRRSVDLQVQALEERTGKKATDADAQRIVDNLMLKGTVNGEERRVFERQAGDRMVVKITDVPPSERVQIEQTLRRNHLPVSDAAVLRLYVRRIGQIPALSRPPE